MESLDVFNPFSLSKIHSLPLNQERDVQEALTALQIGFDDWKNRASWERAALLKDLAIDLEADQQSFSELLSQEAGKPITLATAEVERAIRVLHLGAEEAVRINGDVIPTDRFPDGRSGMGITRRFPRGIILGITPFNFPLNLLVHKLAPAIASGNTILIKPSPFAPLVAKRFCDLVDKRQKNIAKCLILDDSLTARLTIAPEIKMVSFTGSPQVGWQIRKQAFQKPVALELGGNAWVIVDDDLNPSEMEKAANRITSAAFGYAGQSCISVQNIAVHHSIWKPFQSLLAQATKATPFGDPSQGDVVCGPLIHSSARERVEKIVNLMTQGDFTQSQAKRGESDLLLPPTMEFLPEGQEPERIKSEAFGPVASAQPFSNWDQLLQQVNQGPFGLQLGLYSHRWSHIEKTYRVGEVGGVVVNEVPTARYDHQPYGGIKMSGLGREGVRYAIEEMSEGKFLNLSDHVR